MKKPKLFLMHFAGGNCYSFQFLMPFLNSFEVVIVELPGRGQRMGEPLILDFEKASQDFYQQIKPHLDGSPYAIYGHSMGGYFTLKMAGMFEKEGLAPSCIVVSGNAGPGTDRNEKRYLLQGDEFLQELRKLGGVPEIVMENEEMFNFVAPILRADFRLAAENGLEKSEKINVPIFALMGDGEDTVEDIRTWENFTSNDFQCQVLSGEHFFIHDHKQRLAEVIRSFYDQHALGKTKAA